MKKTTFILFFIFTGFILQAQTPYSKNAVYLELLGNAGVYSFNYERPFSPNFNACVGVGTSSGSWFSPGETYIIAYPIMGNYLFGTGSNRFELGGGVLVGSKEVDYGDLNPNNKKFTIFDLTAAIG